MLPSHVARPLRSYAELCSPDALLPPSTLCRSRVPLTAAVAVDTGAARVLFCHDLLGGYTTGDELAQGTDGSLRGYAFAHWPLVDVFVYFSHQRLSVPPASWLEAAHRHGVPVLATLIFEWAPGAADLARMLACSAGDDGNAAAAASCHWESQVDAVAAQLVALALAHGFDGWFFNVECAVPAAQLPRLRYLVASLRRQLVAALPHGQVVWYDSVTDAGALDWQVRVSGRVQWGG